MDLILGMSDIATLKDKQGKQPLVEITMNSSMLAQKKDAYVKIWHPGKSQAGEFSLSIKIEDGSILAGNEHNFTQEQIRIVRIWIEKYKQQLLFNWKKVLAFQKPEKINSDWQTVSKSNSTSPRIIKVKFIKDYKIEITFADGFVGILDMETILEGTGSPLLNKNIFEKVSLSKGFISWESEGIDLETEDLYNFLKGFEQKAS